MMSAAKPKLFFVGVGNMGNPMAANLIKAGYPVTVFDVSRAKADNLIALGATWVNRLAEGAAHADVVMASLPGPVQVREVMLGEQGVLAHVQAGATVIDTSTSAVELVRELVALANSKGVGFLEAPCHQRGRHGGFGSLVYFCGR
jgi:3-hydroxyisobutyrate dehydrogenase